jgi:hypothetical protein
MNITGPLREILSNNLTANTLTGGKVFPVVAPQTTEPPFAIFSIADNTPSDTKSGASTVDIIEVQCDAMAETYDYAQRMDEAIRNALDRYRGNVTVGITHYPIDGIRYLSTQDRYEPEPALFRRISRYKVRLLRAPASIEPSAPRSSTDYPVLELVAGEILSTGRVVILDGEEVFYFEPSDPTHAGRALGVTKSSTSDAGQAVQVQISGIVTDAGISAVADAPCFVGNNGQVLTAYPGTGLVQKCGVGIDAHTIQIDFSIQMLQI